MNYWLLTTEYPPFHGGGISTYCFFTARMLSEADHEVTVFVPDDGVSGYAISAADPGITLVRFNSNLNGLQASLGYAARLSYAFADIVRTIIGQKGRPDFIEAQDYLGIAYYLTQFKHTGYPFLNGVPILITLHSPAFIYLEYNRVPTYRFPDFWTGEMEKQSIIAADALVSPTQFLRDEIQKYMDLSGKGVQVLANPYRDQDSTAASLDALPASHPGRIPPLASFTRNKIVYYGKLSPPERQF